MQQKDRLAQDVTADFVEVHKKTVKNLRMWLPQSQSRVNVLEGQAIYLDGEAALLSCTGSTTLSRTVTADPCLLMVRKGKDVRRSEGVLRPVTTQLFKPEQGPAQRSSHTGDGLPAATADGGGHARSQIAPKPRRQP